MLIRLASPLYIYLGSPYLVNTLTSAIHLGNLPLHGILFDKYIHILYP